jgi:hypothetical protein
MIDLPKLAGNRKPFVVLSTILLMTCIVCAVFTTNVILGTAQQPLGNATNSKYLEIIDHSFGEDFLFTIVNGTVVNNSNSTMNSVKVNVEFYDERGELITANSGTARLVILAPGENSSFSIRSDLGDEIVSSYRVIAGGDIQVGL